MNDEVKSKLMELIAIWRDAQKPSDPLIMSAHDCSDDLEALIEQY